MAAGSFSQVLRTGVDAFNAGDHDGVVDLLADDVEWKRVDGLPDEGDATLHGVEAVRAFLRPEIFDRAQMEVLELVEGDGRALVRGRFFARGAGSGIELDIETYIVYAFDQDLIVHRVENWRRREDAERAAGMRFGPR